MAISAFTKTMSANATTSPSVDVGESWKVIYLETPSDGFGAQVYVQGSSDGSTFKRIKHASINSSTVTSNDYAIASSCSNKMVPIPAGFRYYKLETTATVAADSTFKIICSQNY